MNATASGTIRDGRTAVIKTAIDIARPVEAVFAYCYRAPSRQAALAVG
jgi:hypothetical protein